MKGYSISVIINIVTGQADIVVTELGFKSSLFLQLTVKNHSEGKEIMSGPSSVSGYLGFLSVHEEVGNSHFCLLIQSLSHYNCVI